MAVFGVSQSPKEREGIHVSTSYGVLSTYPPDPMRARDVHLSARAEPAFPADVVGVVDIVDVASAPRSPEVRHQWVRGHHGGAESTAANSTASMSSSCSTSTASSADPTAGRTGRRPGRDPAGHHVLHTVLVTPTLRQKAILDELVLCRTAVVTMTLTAKDG